MPDALRFDNLDALILSILFVLLLGLLVRAALGER